MADEKQFTTEEAKVIGDAIGIDWSRVDLEQFRIGLGVEMEHGSDDARMNVTHGNLETTGKIAWAHLHEYPDYYTRLEKMEKEAEAYWSTRKRPGV